MPLWQFALVSVAAMLLPLSPTARLNAYCYLRKSRDRRERADPDALKRHRSTLLEVARQDGIEIPPSRQYEEMGSGETIANRPEFRALLDHWQSLPPASGGVVYVMDVDRLSRGILTERGQVQDLLLRAGILIRTPAELIDLRQPAQGLLYEIKGSLARHELLIYKARVAATRRDQVLKGQIRTGQVPLGYDWDKNRERPVPNAQFPVLQALCRDAPLLSLSRLAEKYHLPRSTIWVTLTNPMICGWPAQRWLTDSEGVCRPVPREAWLWPAQPGDYPAALSRAEWEQLQQHLGDRFNRRGKTTGDGWCRDVVRFVGHEERRCRLGVHLSRPTYELPILGEPMLYMQRDAVHAAVTDALLTLLGDREWLSAAVLAYRAVQSSERHRIAAVPDLAALQQEAADREAELARLLRREISADEADAGAIRAVRQEIKSELAALRGQIQALAGALPSPGADALLVELTAVPPEEWREVWQSDLTEETRRAIVRGMVERVPVSVQSQGKFSHKRREILPVIWQPWLKIG